MKKLLLATIATVGMLSAASAADLGRMPYKAAPPPVLAPVFSWTGCYIGGYVGGAWNADSTVATDLNGFYAPLGAWGYKTDSSFIGGGTVGCNWQPIGSPFVLGIEGELGYLSMSGSAYDPLSLGTVVSSTTVGDWYGMITGRLGYSWNRALIYAKGGVAFVNVENTIATPAFITSISETQATWTVGGGVEYALDMNWSIKAEYMYIGVGNTDTVGAFGLNWDHENSAIHTAKVGLNYRFGGYGAPVMARY